MEEAFPDRLRRLAREKGLSMERVFIEAYNPEVRGTSPALMKKLMNGTRAVTVTAIEAVARALDVPPEEFPEYRLALARHQLDEREVGLDQALENLERIQSAMQTPQRRTPSHASVPEEASPRPRQASGRAARTRKAS